jgi:hypothetical protein
VIAGSLALAISACSGPLVGVHRPLAPARMGAVGEPSTFERRSSVEDEYPARDRDPSHQRTRTGFFWAGIVLATIGAAGTIGFGVAGYATRRQLDDGYENNDITRKRADTLSDRGEILNALAITSAAVGLAGLVAAVAAYGADYTHCGALARKYRKDCSDTAPRPAPPPPGPTRSASPSTGTAPASAPGADSTGTAPASAPGTDSAPASAPGTDSTQSTAGPR